MSKSINTSDKELERLISSIEETGDSYKILSQDLRERVESALFGNEKIPDGWARSSAAEFGMRRLKRCILDINGLTAQLEKYVFDNYSD